MLTYTSGLRGLSDQNPYISDRQVPLSYKVYWEQGSADGKFCLISVMKHTWTLL